MLIGKYKEVQTTKHTNSEVDLDLEKIKTSLISQSTVTQGSQIEEMRDHHSVACSGLTSVMHKSVA